MVKEVSLLGDIHNDEDSARHYQRFTEVQNPDVVFFESTYGGDQDYTTAVQRYRTMKDIHEAFGAETEKEFYQHPVVSETPIYALRPKDFKKLATPVQEKIDELYDEETTMDEAPLEQREAVHALRDAANILKGKRSSLAMRLSDSAGFMEADVIGLEKKQEREKMFEYGAENVDNLPNSPESVKNVFAKVRRGGMDAYSLMMQGEISGRNYSQGVSDLINEYRPIRDRDIAEKVHNDMEENNYDSALIAVGGRHLEGVQSNLPDSWSVTGFDFTGPKEDWNVGDISSEQFHQKNKDLQKAKRNKNFLS